MYKSQLTYTKKTLIVSHCLEEMAGEAGRSEKAPAFKDRAWPSVPAALFSCPHKCWRLESLEVRQRSSQSCSHVLGREDSDLRGSSCCGELGSAQCLDWVFSVEAFPASSPGLIM